MPYARFQVIHISESRLNAGSMQGVGQSGDRFIIYAGGGD
jgi:hypothetical protein